MNTPPMVSSEPAHYELRFQSLLDARRAYAFPCGVAGRVNMDALSDRARENYLYARAVVGREFSIPTVTAGAARPAEKNCAAKSFSVSHTAIAPLSQRPVGLDSQPLPKTKGR
jgi:hypothetical protein